MGDGVLEAARRIAAAAGPRAEEIEAGRRLPADLADAMRDAGLFKLLVPQALDGAEVDPLTLLEAIEVVSAADGSTGWCLMIGATTGVCSGRLAPDAAKEIFGPPESVTGGVLAPRGTATPVEGGYRLHGRWPFGSGSQHSTWLCAAAFVEGTTDVRLCFVPAADVEILDTWFVSGLRGTGSHDFAIDGALVPEARAMALDRPPVAAGPLYRMPLFGTLAASVAAVALGIASAAIDDFVALAAGKVATGQRRRLAERANVQADIARAATALRAGRTHLHDVVGDVWATVESGGQASTTARAALRGAATHAATVAAAATDTAYTLAGATGIYTDHPLQRRFRDVHVATQHMMVGPPTWELAGQGVLGLDIDAPEL